MPRTFLLQPAKGKSLFSNNFTMLVGQIALQGYDHGFFGIDQPTIADISRHIEGNALTTRAKHTGIA